MDNIKSMTGYGKATNANSVRRITVEIKSLNSKQLDLSAKIPNIYRGQEYQIRAKVAKALSRGKIELYVHIENLLAQTSTTINKEMFNAYLTQIKELNCDMSNVDIIASLLKLPDVLSTPKQDIEDAEIELLNQTVDIAIEEFNRFRSDEGQAMIKDILSHIQTIENLLEDVKKYDAGRTENIKNRILENLEKINVSLDKSRLEQEMIYYLEKLDITEEKVRLRKHIDYFREICDTEEGVGKKLGFVAQEIGREINTLGSKSNNADMQQIVVVMKDSLEKVKEQMLNIL